MTFVNGVHWRISMQYQRHHLLSPAGTPLTYHDKPPVPAPDVNFNGDICLHTRLYTYKTDTGVVAGWTMSVMFTVERPAREVWPYVKDFNLWQNAYGHYYMGVDGERPFVGV